MSCLLSSRPHIRRPSRFMVCNSTKGLCTIVLDQKMHLRNNSPVVLPSALTQMQRGIPEAGREKSAGALVQLFPVLLIHQCYRCGAVIIKELCSFTPQMHIHKLHSSLKANSPREGSVKHLPSNRTIVMCASLKD